MRISARCDYACRAIMELALHWPRKLPLHIQVISERQNIPIKYLIQILIQLKRRGLAISIRGKEGGYNLSKAPAEITLGEVMRQTGGPLLPLADSAAKNKSVFFSIWKEAEGAIAKVLDQITFEDIAKKARNLKGAISYQI